MILIWIFKIWISGFSFKFDFYYTNGTHNKSIRIDMIFKYIVHPGLPGKCLRESAKKTLNVAPQDFVNFRCVCKDMFQEVQDETYT